MKSNSIKKEALVTRGLKGVSTAMWIRIGRILVIILIFLPLMVSAEDKKEDIKIVTTEGKSYFGDDTTQLQAKLNALNQARRNALEQATGIHVRSSSSMYNGELISELIDIAAKGLIVNESLEENCGIENGRFYCSVRLTAYIKPLAEKKSALKIREASVYRAGKDIVAKSPVFQDYDEVQVKVIASEPAFLNIFSVDQYGNVMKLYPNEYVKSEQVSGRKAFVFPDESLVARGLKLKVTVPKKLNKALESIIVVATDREAHLLENGVESPTITDLMREISELDPVQWAAGTVGYEVRK